jgi:hypothetical protein
MKMPMLHREPEEQPEEVDGVLCWDPETGPVGPGPHGPRPHEYRLYEGRDGCLKVAPILRTDDGRERYEWDDDKEEYIRPQDDSLDAFAWAAAMAGEKASHHPQPKVRRIFVRDAIDESLMDEVTKEKLKDIMNKYFKG